MINRKILSKIIQVEAHSIPFKTENILKSLQVPPDKADKYLLEQIDLFREKCYKLSRPCGCYSIHYDPQFDTNSGTISVNNAVFSLGKIVTHALKKSTGLAFFICTCGSEVEKLSKQLIKEGQTLEGYIVDLIGSEIAEGMADIIHQQIGKNTAKEKMNYTNRYSPGYCNWPVSDQQLLFPLLDNTCGVSLTQSSLMIPIKSVSGVIGIGPDVKFKGYSCNKCDASFCIYRDKQ